MKVVYAVEYIEVDFGQRSEGYSLYTNLEDCKQDTKKSSFAGSGSGSYWGPVRPLSCVEVPWDSLDKKLQKALKLNGKTHTENNWSPPFRGQSHRIE